MKSGEFGTYGAFCEPVLVNGWYVYVNSFEVDGLPIRWRWKKTKDKYMHEKFSYMGWNDKNPRARKYENKYFTTREDALAFAVSEAKKTGKVVTTQ